MIVDPTGRFLYTVDSGSDTVSMFTITPATGLLTSVGTALSVNDDPQSVAVDGSGRFAYVVSAGTNRIQGFAIDSATGGLGSVMSPLATGANPQAVATDPTGRFVYAANTNANNLTRVGSASIPSGTFTTPIAIGVTLLIE